MMCGYHERSCREKRQQSTDRVAEKASSPNGTAGREAWVYVDPPSWSKSALL